MGEQATEWVYPLLATSQDSKSSRISVQKPYSSRLIGVDGSLDGPIRVFPGFREVHRFDVDGWGSEHNDSSEIWDLQMVNFTVGDDGYAYGMVYRVRRRNGATGAGSCDVFADFWNSQTGQWSHSNLVKAAVPPPTDKDLEEGKIMSVVVQGRFVYVLIENQEPISFWLTREAPWTFTVLTDTGPGKRPDLTSPEDAEALGSLEETGDDERPGRGQVVLLEFKPSETSLFTYSGTGSVGSSGTFFGQDEQKLGSLAPGDYAFAYVLYNSQNGRRSALSEVAQARKVDFSLSSSGDVVPEAELYAAMEICYRKDKYDQAYIYRSVRVQSAGGTYIAAILHLDRIINLEDYHTVNNPLADTDLGQAIYWYELEDKQLVFQDTFNDRTLFDENMPFGGAALWYENTLLISSIRNSSPSSSEENRRDDGIRGIGEIRWSSLTDVCPELFPPANRYVPSLQSNNVIGFRRVSPNAIGFSRDRQYHVRKEGTAIKFHEIHEGFGMVNDKAADTAGSIVYFLSPKGLKAVDSQAQLDDVAAINDLILGPWAASLASTSVAFDPYLSALFIYNEEEGECATLWFNTAKVTMLQDLPFRQVVRGSWPIYYDFTVDLPSDTHANPLIERCFFVQNPPKTSSTDRTFGFRHRLFIVDQSRENVHTEGSHDGERCTTLLPVPGDTLWEVKDAFTVSTILYVEYEAGAKIISQDIAGYKLYVLQAADPLLVGRSATVKARYTFESFNLLSTEASQLHGLQPGDILGLSPVYFEWQGYPISNGQEGGDWNDLFRMKHLSSLGCAFSDVAGPALDEFPTAARFRGLAFLGSDTVPTSYGDTRSGDGEFVRSIVDKEGSYYDPFGTNEATEEGRHGVQGSTITPGVRIIVPDLDYRLLAVRVEGKVLESYRGTRAS